MKLAQERLRAIAEQVSEKGKVMVKDLSQEFGVTEDCIRKDLKALELQGILKRAYGGAIAVKGIGFEKNVDSRFYQDTERKMKIATKAYALLRERDTVFLDISTTNVLLARLIAQGNKRITVVTNMLEILNTLVHAPAVTTICCGGILSEDAHGFIGSSAIRIMDAYRFDKVFIGSVGLSLTDGMMSTFDMEDGITKKAIMDHAKENYFIMEHHKFYTEGNYRFCSLQDVDHIITDELPDDETLELLREKQVEVLQA